MKSAKVILLVVCALGLGIGINKISTHIAEDDKGTANQIGTKQNIDVGKANYDALCADCHGVNAVGTDKGPTFIHRVYHPGHHGDASFYAAPMQGVKAHHWSFGDMPRIEAATEPKMKTIVAYIRALQKANGVYE